MINDDEFMIGHDEKIRITKENIMRILCNRGFIHKNSLSNMIGKLIDTNINDVCFIDLDNNANYNTVINDGKIMIKYFDYSITSSSKGSDINDFINKNPSNYKILIVKDFVNKSIKTLKMGRDNLEIFSYDQLIMNLVDHKLMPDFVILNSEERDNLLFDYNAIQKNMPWMYSNDPVALYYNLKPGDICKEIRKSTNGETIFYRLVILGV